MNEVHHLEIEVAEIIGPPVFIRDIEKDHPEAFWETRIKNPEGKEETIIVVDSSASFIKPGTYVHDPTISKDRAQCFRKK